MLLNSTSRGLLRAVGLGLVATGALGDAQLSSAQALFSEVHTIAAATTGVPQEFTFDASVAGAYTLTLTDLGASLSPPAPLGSVKVAVTAGATLVGPPLVGAGTFSLGSLATGSYELHVIGMPGSVPGSGPFGIQVQGPGGAQFAFQGVLALPSQGLPSGEAVLDDSFTVQSSGSYTVSLADLQLPQSLGTLSLLLIQPGNAQPLATLSSPTLQANVQLTGGVTYDIFAVGQTTAGVSAGLFSAVVTAAGGTIVYGRAVPVGSTISIGSPVLTAGSDTFTLADLAYPAALSQVGAVLTLNGLAKATLSAAGSQPFAAAVGTYEAFAVATPGSSPGEGSYSVSITQGATTAFSVARAVTAAGSSASAYSFDTSLSTGGMYGVSFTDFQFPAALSSRGLGVVQNGVLLGSLASGATSVNVSPAAGTVSLLAFAQAASGGGLFGIDVTPSAGGSSVFGVTQGVGALFIARKISITAAGSYSVTAADLGFSANFANFDTVVTQGTTQLGSIFGGGTFNFAATPGNYFLNFMAQPSGTDQAGSYALTVATAAPPPVVSLTDDNSQVPPGSTVNLIWSTQNATSCTASGGWSGSVGTSGRQTSPPIRAATTFTLSCTGAGGTASQSVSVTVTAPSGSGGGGALDAEFLALAFGVLAVRASRKWLPTRRLRRH